MNGLIVLAVGAAERGQWWPDTWVGRLWVLFGLVAQATFAGRFIVQWIASELRGKSHIPLAFWYLSIVGSVMLLTYAVLWKHDVVLTLGQGSGIIVYVRNLMLLHREKKLTQAAGGARPAG